MSLGRLSPMLWVHESWFTVNDQECYLFLLDAIAKWIILFDRVVHAHSELKLRIPLVNCLGKNPPVHLELWKLSLLNFNWKSQRNCKWFGFPRMAEFQHYIVNWGSQWRVFQIIHKVHKNTSWRVLGLCTLLSRNFHWLKD